VNCF